jgi:hypothetical protein
MPTFIDIPAHFRSHDSRVHATDDNLLGPEDFIVDAYMEQVMTMPQVMTEICRKYLNQQVGSVRGTPFHLISS